jgi:hypothetical protein
LFNLKHDKKFSIGHDIDYTKPYEEYIEKHMTVSCRHILSEHEDLLKKHEDSLKKLIEKEELHDSIIVSMGETIEIMSKFLDSMNLRTHKVEQHQMEILHNQNVIIASMKLKKDKRLKKMRELKFYDSGDV